MQGLRGLKEIEGQVKWYTCGPTIYSRSHWGHARTFTTVDLMVRTYRALGVPIDHLMNITDIDDKILNRLIKQNFDAWRKTVDGQAFETGHAMIHRSGYASLDEVPVEWIQAHASSISMGPVSYEDYKAFITKMERHFWEDMRGLGNEPLDRVLRVSDLVDDLVGYIEKLLSRDMAYEAKGSVYLDSKALFNRDIGDLLFAPRSEGKTQDKMEGFAADKKCDQDFALWKAAKPFELAFDSPWSKGRPGWHIECSLMIDKAFGPEGPTVHAGGIDLRFPHHHNEWLVALAAKEESGWTDELWCDRWVHVGHLMVESKGSKDEGIKMSQSLGNVKTIQELLESKDPLYDPQVLRFLWLMSSWEKPLTLSSEVLVTAKAHLDRVRSFLVHVNHLRQRWSPSQPTSESNPSSNPPNNYGLVASDLDGQLVDLFSLGFLSDKAIHIIFKAIEEVYKTKSSNPAPFFHLGSVVAKWFKIWGFDFSDSQTSSDSKEEELLDLVVHLREELRSLAKSSGFHPLYSLSDRIRDVYLKDLGISLEDRTGLGTKRF